MLEGLDAFSFALLGAAGITVMLLARAYYKFDKEQKRIFKHLRDKASGLEFEAQNLRSEIRDLQESTKNKVELDYLNKRIDALINLINGK